MTRRTSIISRRHAATLALPLYVEIAAAGVLWSWFGFRTAEWATRRFWAAIKQTHGGRITDKVREAMPGCRPGFDYAVGRFPPVPLVEAIPPEHMAQREHLDVDGVRHWHVGQPWQRCQAEHLRELGEVDGREWIDYTRWRDAGFPARYVLDDDDTRTPCRCIVHLCC